MRKMAAAALVTAAVSEVLLLGACTPTSGDSCDTTGNGGYGGLGLGGGGSLSFGGSTAGGGGGGPGGSSATAGGASGEGGTQSGDTCFGKPATQYIDCRKRGLNADACAAACDAAGAPCGSFTSHPYKSGEGMGLLTWCKNGSPTYTCTYTFASGDGCAGVFAPPTYKPFWICLYK